MLCMKEKAEETLKSFEIKHKTIMSSYLETIFHLTRIAEYADSLSDAHIKRVGYYCEFIAGLLGLTSERRENILYAAPMHDIGKIGVPDKILVKPASLTPEEFEIMKQHAWLGAKILGNAKSEILKMGAMIAESHHEHWDGSGYPKGLKGDEIPLEGRIMYITDIYDALRSPRPYKNGLDHTTTYDIILKGDHKVTPAHFDPQLLDIFIKNHKKFEEIFSEYSKKTF